MNWEERYQQSHRPQPRSGSSFGLKLFIVLLALAPFVVGVIWTSRHEVKPQEVADDFKKRAEEWAQIGEWVTKNPDPHMARTPEEKLEQMQKLLERISALGGETGATFKVAADYVADVKRLGTAYGSVKARFGVPNPFDFSNVKAKAEIQRRRMIALDLLKLNRELISMIDATPDRLHAGFQKAGTVGAIADVARALSSEKDMKELMAYRKWMVAEGKIIQCMVDACDLLEGDWGRWHGQNGNIAFDLPASAVKFNIIGADFQSARQEQGDADKEEAALKNK